MTIALLGTGNVAYHLAQQWQADASVDLLVWSRRAESANAFARELKVNATHRLTELPHRADLYVLAVSDGAITTVAEYLAKEISPQALVVHTSGATPSNILAPFFSHHGVFYPLQTFSRAREVLMTEVPFCLWASRAADFGLLKRLAENISKTVLRVDDAQRTRLHLAAVFVNNFTNYLQHISQSMLEEHNLPQSLLHPLLKETVAKLEVLSPLEAQTGPAIRGDKTTIQRHLSLLKDHPDWAAVYHLLSQEIGKLKATD